MVPLDAELKALAAIVSLAFGLVALMVPRRGPRNLWLGAFMLLIAGNQGAETMRALAESTRDQNLWFRLASVCASLDPLALLLFASSALSGARRFPTGLVTYAAVAGGVLAFVAGWTLDYRFASVFGFCLAAHTALIYGWVLVEAIRMLRREPSAPSWASLVPAMAVAALPVVMGLTGSFFYTFLLPVMIRPDAARLGLPVETVAFSAIVASTGVLVGALMLGGLAREAKRAAGEGRRSLLVATIVAGAVILVVVIPGFVLSRAFFGDDPVVYAFATITGRSSAPVRWLVFGAFTSAMVLRDEELRFSPAFRRRASRGLLALAFATFASMAAAIVASLLGGSTAVIAGAVIVVLAALAISQGFRGLVERTASGLYGVGREEENDASPIRLAPGARIAGRYRVSRALGRGASSQTFLAWDERLRRDVVLKEVRASEDGPEALREARIAGAIQHPFVIAVHDVLARGSTAILVTEHVAGGTLGERLAREGPMPQAEGIAFFEKVVEGVRAVHALGVIHRDLAPHNVLLTAEGWPKISDFGIAGHVSRRTVALGEGLLRMGTPGFAAPEQARGETPTPAADVYALGALARATIAGPLPPELERVVARAMTLDPRERWPDAGALLDAWKQDKR